VGSRAYLIKQISDSHYKYTYAHHGAGKFKRLSDLYYYSEKEITDEDIAKRFSEIWEHSKQKGEEIRTATSLDEIVNVEQITIEAYIIEDQSDEYHAIFPTISSKVNVAVTKPLKSITDLNSLKKLHRQISDYLRVAENQELEEATIREGVRKAVTEYRRDGYTLLIEEDESPQSKVFNRLSRVIA